MVIRYEANPPKIIPGIDKDQVFRTFVNRIKEISQQCDAIHLTENVLGYQRISPVEVGRMLKEENVKIPITASLRVRDKNYTEITDIVNECIEIGFEGILIIMGDPLRSSSASTTIATPRSFPSNVVKKLKESDIDKKIDLYLSVPNTPNPSKIVKKIKAEPDGFMTQVVSSISQVQNITKIIDGFPIIPILLYPSAKNAGSAKFLNLDLESYGKEFDKFVRGIHDITEDLLITSPSDFNGIYQFLKKFQCC